MEVVVVVRKIVALGVVGAVAETQENTNENKTLKL